MATNEQSGENPKDAKDLLASFASSTVESYRHMETPVGRYLTLVVAPAAVFFLLTVVAFLLTDFPLLIRGPIPLLGLLAVGVAVIYPKILRDQKRKEIEDSLHLFITHMTILSTANIDRVEVFRTLGEEEEYGALAEEMRRITQLVDTWNQSLDDALRIRANKSPSKPFADFLDRLAYTINAGQEIQDFLLSEQDVVIQNYVTIYEGSLQNLEVMKDLYLSMVLSVTFALVFATVLPILTGTNPTMTVSAVVVMFAFVQTGFLVMIRTTAPYDPVWYHPQGTTTDTEWRIRISVAVGILLTFLAIGACLLILLGRTSIDPNAIPLPFYAAIPSTPLLIPGLVARKEEEQIKERDEEFTSFIRALGATETAKQSTTTKVLESLRGKNFGALTENVDDLYKRLNMRIEPAMAWRHFTADSRSYLIQKFSEMFLVGRQMGGDPKQLGELIAANMNEVLQLRERRAQSTVTLIGVLYGITAASTFAFFIGLEIVEVLAGMSIGLDSSQLDVTTIIHTNVYDIPTIEYLLIIITLLNAVLSALMVRIADGGHKVNSYMHFVFLTWMSSAIAVFTRIVVGSFLNV
ncbi:MULTISPECIES: archaellar assembly protein FlaJ [Halorussus]|uniref:archaellar assembly protein FlaJ n=1 Tax=Halorussus TaxID=1070314 RepID=UPI000E215E5D|nr:MULTISPECIES: archaellar assembly protein FlaJ [Halorussus]NHN59167.1 archaellar assembly protein FlaJ [Halorussus sp. JP-T4]